MKNIIFCFFNILFVIVETYAKDEFVFSEDRNDSSYVFIAAIFEGPEKIGEGDIYSGGSIFFRIKPDYLFRNNYSNPLQFFNENGYNKFIYNPKEYLSGANCHNYKTPSPEMKKLHFCIAIYKIKEENIKFINFSPQYNLCPKLEIPILFEKVEINDCSSFDIVSYFYFDLGYDNFSWDEYDQYECLKQFFRWH